MTEKQRQAMDLYAAASWTGDWQSAATALAEALNASASCQGSESELLETATLIANSMGDVVKLQRFARAVDPIRLVTDWHTDLCYAIHQARAACQGEASPQVTALSAKLEQLRADIVHVAVQMHPQEPVRRLLKEWTDRIAALTSPGPQVTEPSGSDR